MRILMINVVCGFGSTGRICTDLASVLKREGNEVIIAYGRGRVPKEFEKYSMRIGTPMGVRIHGIKARMNDSCGFGSRRATEKFIAWVKHYNPDIIHLHNIHGYYINLEVLFNYLRTCGKKIIWTLHDCWAFTGHSVYCDAVDCNRWIDGCYSCPNMRLYPASLIDRSSANWNKKKSLMSGIPNLIIVTPSEWLASWVRKSFLSQYQVVVIYNGINTKIFRPVVSDFKEEYGISEKKMILGVATSWDDRKGLSDYYKLADMLDSGYQVVLVGLTRKQIGRLPKNIIGIEKTNSVEELVKIYSSADVYVNLSYCESFGMTNVEAQLCGTPIVTYDSGGCVESAGEKGIVVKKGDLEGIFNALNNVKPIEYTNNDIDLKISHDRYLQLFQ